MSARMYAKLIAGEHMAKSFTSGEWKKIQAFCARHGERFGLPRRRNRSVILGAFNIRKLGNPSNKSPGAWKMLAHICKQYDLLAVQEVLDNLDGIRQLKSMLGPEYGLVVSDTTGAFPGESSTAERLAFLFRWKKVSRTEIASDITYDRTKVNNTLFQYRQDFWQAFQDHNHKLAKIEKENQARSQEGKRRKSRPPVPNPHFISFIRQPLCASFEIKTQTRAVPYQFLAVNCHLLYGKDPAERRREFYALLSWLIERAKKPERMYYPNLLVMGDCNLEFKRPAIERPKIEAFLKSLNKSELDRQTSAELNFPFLDVHPGQSEVYRTAARQKDTYDQIGILFRDKRLPDYTRNKVAGATPNGYDYGVFNFVEMFAAVLHGKGFKELDKAKQRDLLAKFEHDLTDHMPIWIRLETGKTGAG
ncbi:hypothetical protein KAR10_02965, partial [bacterium]|nr:hypothetical protein [bacterium]